MVATRSTPEEDMQPATPVEPIEEPAVDTTPAVADAEQMAAPIPLPPLEEPIPQPMDYRSTDYMGPPGRTVTRANTFYVSARARWSRALGHENLIQEVTASGGDQAQYAEAVNTYWPMTLANARMALNDIQQALNLVALNREVRNSGVPSRYEELTETFSSLERQINSRPEFFVNSLAPIADTTSDTTNRGDVTLRNSAKALLANLDNFKSLAPHFGGKEGSDDDIDFRSFFARDWFRPSFD